MENANIYNPKFEKLINELIDITNSLYQKDLGSTTPKSKVFHNKILRALFDTEDEFCSTTSNSNKINQTRRPIRYQNILDCMNRLWQNDDPEDEIEDCFNDFYESLDLLITGRNISSSTRDKQIERESNYDQSVQNSILFCKKIDDLYERHNPYPWLTIGNSCTDNDDYYDNSVTCRKLLYLITSIGLHTNNIKKTRAEYIETPMPSGFEEFQKEHRQFILFGPPDCGKTAFLTNYAIRHNSSFFYIDATEIYKTKNEYESILRTMRPDYCFWKDADIPMEQRSAFIDPWFKYPKIPKKSLGIFISPGDTLIIDNITSIEQINYYVSFLPCHIIFASDNYNLSSQTISYDFCDGNKDNYGRIFTGLIKENLDEAILSKILVNLGSNLYVYRLVALNYTALKKTPQIDATDFLNQIASSSDIEPFNEAIDKNAKNKISLQYKDKNTGRYIRDYIELIYSNRLTSVQQRVLHLLYRCQRLTDGKISLTEFCPYLNLDPKSGILNELINLGWLTEDTISIPLVIVSSLNDVQKFSNQEYSEFLKMIGKFDIILSGLSPLHINSDICIILIRAIHEDFKSYIKSRAQVPSDDVQKYYYKKISKMSKEEWQKFRETGLSPKYYNHDENDPFGDLQFMDWMDINEFYCSAIEFCLEYAFNKEAKELLMFVSDPENISYYCGKSINYYIWKLRMALLENSMKHDFLHSQEISNLDEAFEKFYNYKPTRKNEHPKDIYDNKPIVIAMYNKALIDFQFLALQLWKSTVSDYNPILEPLKDTLLPFLNFNKYAGYYELLYPSDEAADAREYQLLNELYNLFYEISESLNDSEVSFPSWSFDRAVEFNYITWNLYRQYYILYNIMGIYYYTFIRYNAKSATFFKDVLLRLYEEKPDDQLPECIGEMLHYALTIE